MRRAIQCGDSAACAPLSASCRSPAFPLAALECREATPKLKFTIPPHVKALMGNRPKDGGCKDAQDAARYHDIVAAALMQRPPRAILAANIGSVEWDTLRHCRVRELGCCDEAAWAVQAQNDRRALEMNAGVWPSTPHFLRWWCQFYAGRARKADVMMLWHPAMKACPAIATGPGAQILGGLWGQWPWLWTQPYTRFLANLTVLVISSNSYVRAIAEQYHKRRNRLFPFNPSVLPAFAKLETLAVPNPPWGGARNYTWRDALAGVERKMRATRFDVVLIGAGAYGVPLGATAKEMGKAAIVLGGGLGPLFGLKGKRYDRVIEYPKFFYTDAWVRTQAPAGFVKNSDNDAYW